MVNKQILFNISRQILSDIETVLHFNSSGSFYLPEDVGGELTYVFLGQDLIVELEWNDSVLFDKNVVTGDYYNDEGSIKLVLMSSKEITRETISNIGEVLTHELTHWLQEMGGYEFPPESDMDYLDYYLQPHELEAQYYGFQFESEYLNLPLVSVVHRWFDKYGEFHEVEDIELIRDSLLERLEEFSEKI